MALPLSSQPLSSLLPSLEHTDSISSITPSLPSTTDAPHFPYSWSQGHNRRFSLLGNLKFPNNNNFTSFIRSHRSALPFEGDEPEIAQQVGVSGYADLFFQQPSLAMSPGSPPEEERLSRKSKSENRFYNFLTRSRSRSRSKQEENPTASTLPTIPHNDQRSMRHSTDSQSKHTQGSKPASRIPSRPLSSTTTATNTTVTPGTPRPSKRSVIPVSPANTHENAHPSRPTTPKPSAARKTLQTLFGIPLALASRKSSRSRSRSRPNSPRPSVDVPPLPTSRIEDDSTPKPRKSFSPHPKSRPNSPTPASKHKNIDSNLNNVSTGSTSGSMRLPRFFSGRSTQPDANGPKDSAIATLVSAPLRRPSTHRRSSKSGADHESLADTSSNARAHTSAAPPPKIIHTPATPLKGGGPASPSQPATGRLTHNWKNSSLDSGYRYRGAAMGVVDEESKTGPELAKSMGVKGKEKMTELSPRTGLKKMSNTTRATKHGSFDFERPGWGALMMQRTGSGGTTGTTTSGWSRDNTQRERESAFGPGLAGVGTLQRDASVKRGRDREEQVKARERAKRLEQYIEKDKIASAQKTPQGSSSAHSDHPGASTSTNGTGHTGKSSSMSKATGKKSSSGNSKSGAGRMATQHGLFSFEPPVSAPARSTGSTGTNPEVSVSWGGRAEQEKERLREERERQRDRERKAPQRGDRPPVPVPNVGHRSGTKGRSLDLGLGLAWAPTKMREDALMPSSAFFNRSLSNTSSGRTASASTGRSASSSTTGNGSGRSRRIHLQDSEPDVERSKLGRDVAEVFRSALDADGYTSFKTYVHQFDAHEIPFDGPSGIIPQVERLLSTAPALSEEGKKQLLDNFVRVILQHA